MLTINRVTILGRLGQDPEVRYSPSGNAVATLSVATDESWNNKATGERQERTEWHRVVVFGKAAEFVRTSLRKGDPVYVEGRLQTRKWQDRNGQDRWTTEIVVDVAGRISAPCARDVAPAATTAPVPPSPAPSDPQTPGTVPPAAGASHVPLGQSPDDDVEF